MKPFYEKPVYKIEYGNIIYFAGKKNATKDILAGI